MEASHKAAVSLLEEQLLNAEGRLARESEQCRHLDHRWVLQCRHTMSTTEESRSLTASCSALLTLIFSGTLITQQPGTQHSSRLLHLNSQCLDPRRMTLQAHALHRRVNSLERYWCQIWSQTWLLACRRLLDIEGWASDMTLLRQQMAATNRKLQQMRLASRLPGQKPLLGTLTHAAQQSPHPKKLQDC